MAIRNDYLMRLIEKCVIALAAYGFGKQVDDPQAEIIVIDAHIGELTGLKPAFIKTQIRAVIEDVTPEIAYYIGQFLERRVERMVQMNSTVDISEFLLAELDAYARSQSGPHGDAASIRFFDILRRHSQDLTESHLFEATMRFVTEAERGRRYAAAEDAIFFVADSDIEPTSEWLDSARLFYQRLIDTNDELVRAGGLEPEDLVGTLTELNR